MLIQERLTSGSLPGLLSWLWLWLPRSYPRPQPHPRPQALEEFNKGTAETCGPAMIGKGTPLKSSISSQRSLMESSLPISTGSIIPILYHFTQALFNSSITTGRSLTLNCCPACMLRSETSHILSIFSASVSYLLCWTLPSRWENGRQAFL